MGDKCGDSNYKVIYYFNNVDKNKENEQPVNYKDLNLPNKTNEEDCLRKIEININFDDYIEYLLIQRFINDYWIFTGIVFLIIGVYLMILAKNKRSTKFIISIIFGEMFSFSIACGLLGINNKYMEWCFFPVGLVLGYIIGFFSLKGNRLFHSILSITAGYIFGIIIFDFIFCHQNYKYAQILLADNILVFTGLFFVCIYLAPGYHYYCNSIIGSYIFVRGITILCQKLGKYARFRELQLILYLLNKYELDYAIYYYEEHWPIYYVYDIIIVLFMGLSILYYKFRIIGNHFDDENNEENEENLEENLNGNKYSTSDGTNEELN